MYRPAVLIRALKTTPIYLTRRTSTMATARTIQIGPQDTGLSKVKQTGESAKKATELLQQDLEKHHVFFNDDGFHNHIVHHILSLFGTGANPAQLQKAFDQNSSYQRPVRPLHDDVVKDLFQSWDHARAYLGKEKHYPDFLAFFQREIAAKGWEAVLSEYLFAGTESADDLLVRLYAGFLHPLIQLMYGVEWRQPAIVAEAVAQACVHKPDFKEELIVAETNARVPGAEMPSIVALLDEVRMNSKLSTAVRMEDANKIRDGVLKRAGDEMLGIVSKVKVRPEDLDERTAEMFDASFYMAASATFQHPQKWNKFDFFLIHHTNSAPIFLTFNAQPWIPVETKVRLLEWKIRYDLIQYAGRAIPLLSLDPIKKYQPKNSGSTSVGDTISRVRNLKEDDGHGIKLARSAVICHELSKKFEDREWMMIRGDETWNKIHNLIADSLESPGGYWLRTTGLDEAWKDIPNKSNI